MIPRENNSELIREVYPTEAYRANRRDLCWSCPCCKHSLMDFYDAHIMKKNNGQKFIWVSAFDLPVEDEKKIHKNSDHCTCGNIIKEEADEEENVLSCIYLFKFYDLVLTSNLDNLYG